MLAGATKMDRPEWIDTFPESLTAIGTLTNNTRRGTAGLAGRPTPMNPRTPNPTATSSAGPTATTSPSRPSSWDIFALCGDPPVPAHGSTIIGDKYGSPMASTSRRAAGCGFRPMSRAAPSIPERMPASATTRCCAPIPRPRRPAVPGRSERLRDHRRVRHARRADDVRRHPASRRGAAGTTIPANPKRYSSWPDGAEGGRPRSAVIVITKDDGGEIGS